MLLVIAKVSPNKTLCERIFGRGCNKRTCMRDMWVVQWYCIFEGLVETCEAASRRGVILEVDC